MTALAFEITSARVEPHAAVPTIAFGLHISETTGEQVHALVLRCQIRIEPHRRKYTSDEEERLYELFGETPHWGDSLRPFLWTHSSATFGSFSGDVEFELPVECTYDFEVAAAKYLHSLAGDEVPLLFLFSGTVFTRGDTGFAAEPISWDRESSYRMPVQVWRRVMDLYFPNSGWLRLHRDTIDKLQHYRSHLGLPTWDQALEGLLKDAWTESP